MFKFYNLAWTIVPATLARVKGTNKKGFPGIRAFASKTTLIVPSLCTFWSPSLYWCSPGERLRVCHNQKEATRLDQPADMLSVSYVSEDDPWGTYLSLVIKKNFGGRVLISSLFYARSTSNIQFQTHLCIPKA